MHYLHRKALLGARWAQAMAQRHNGATMAPMALSLQNVSLCINPVGAHTMHCAMVEASKAVSPPNWGGPMWLCWAWWGPVAALIYFQIRKLAVAHA